MSCWPGSESGSQALPEVPTRERVLGRPSWDPRSQPCIPTVALDGATAHHSLRAVFAEADRLSAISCATPGETVAVIEFLLAICFASGTCPADADEWRTWITEARALDSAAEWLAAQPADAWDLFHPEFPLGQNALLRQDLDAHGTGTAQLVIEHTGDYSQLFDHHHLERDDPLPAADAFRAMLTQHVYAPSGRARMSGERLGASVTNLSAGRLLGRVRVVALGRTLGETLRLNLYPPEGPSGPLNTSWTTAGIERRTFEAKAKPRAPRDAADLHSALGRSIALRPKRAPGGQLVVDRVLIGAGEVLALDPERHLQDAVFRQTTNGLSKPLWPSHTRALWQDAHALYGAVREAGSGLYARLRSLPYTRRGPGAPYQMWAVGLLANKSLPVAWTQGTYPYAPGLARHLHHASYRGSVVAEHVADSLKRAAIVAAEIVYPAAHATDEGGKVARFDARWTFWPAAAQPFYELLDEVVERGAFDDDDPVSEPLIEYARTLLASARTHLGNCLDSLPPNDRGHRARARAEQRFEKDMNHQKVPELRGEIAHD
ncbi:type I-E CRISPR-associated protein Cse1/CasA [Streptomyces sp. DSM 44915]|uniref:Type I-E CRISPR-associated protein Cse1/CasA n=1 Tax=Streptomyces chisholmiae TaxID=3075540 RepID=A0ABU2JPS6_9ACTN|nr:type I-E CRISPR-associated protein Cse1/CasA [Streptomyces sp. DSM 44915]MDT0266724.1 type I-E CRISPR-associated protein Cse1/CasA [Streptomyces sp. DSM 44915]